MNITHLFNENTNWHTDPEQQSMDATRRARLGREREPAGGDAIDARLAANNNARQQYAETGHFWLKQKDTQQHLNDQPYTGKAAANAAALELLKQQPELRGNLVITAYGPGEQQITEGRVKELGQDLKDKAMSDAEFKAKYSKTRAEVRAAMREKQGVAEGSEKTKPNKPMTWQQAYAHNDGESFDARQKRITQYEKSKGEKKPKHVDWDKKGGMQEGVAEGSLEEMNRRGFLKGLAGAGAALAAGGAIAKGYNPIYAEKKKKEREEREKARPEQPGNHQQIPKPKPRDSYNSIPKEGVAEAAKWRTHPDAHYHDYEHDSFNYGQKRAMGDFDDTKDELHGRTFKDVEGGKLTKRGSDYRKAYIKRSLGKHPEPNLPEQGVAEGSEEMVGFHLDSERAYEAVMAKFGHVIDHDEDSGIMYVPERLWPTVEATAYDADGIGAQRDDDLENPEHYGVEEAQYDGGDYYNARQGSEYGRDLNATGSGGPGAGTKRDDIFKGQSRKLPADPFSRTTGEVPYADPGRVHRLAQPDEMDENEKIGNMDADRFDAAMARLKQLAGAGPMRTVYDPEKRVYKNVPTAQQPGDKK